MDPGAATVRPYRGGDLEDLYRICLLTADNGQDATGQFSDPRLPGHVYAAPYGRYEPALAFVAEDRDGVAGYILGARDTRAFEARLERDWWPGLRARYPAPPAGLPTERWTRDQTVAYHMHHPWPTDAGLADRYPSHLHINLLPRLQGRGLGRRLIETLTAALRDQGSPGVHLHVGVRNQPAGRFYARTGFTELTGQDAVARVFVMDLRQAPERS